MQANVRECRWGDGVPAKPRAGHRDKRRRVAIADAQQDQLLRDALAQILKQDFPALEATLKRMDLTGAGEPAIQQSMKAVAGMPGVILESFRKDAGKEVQVAFLKANEPLRIVNVDDNGNIHAEKLIRIDGRLAGSTAREFTLRDLSVRERLNRLGAEATTERQIMRGLLAWEASKPEVAKRFFTESRSSLGDRLVARIFEMDADAAAAAAAAQKAAREAAATKAFEDILKSAGLASLQGDAEKLIAAIETTRFTEGQVAEIRRNLRLFDGDTAATDAVKDNKAALECFALVRPNFPITVDQATLDKAIEELAKDNPKEIIRATFTRTPGKLSLALRKYPSLTDLSALAGIPLTSLTLEGCDSLVDLRPLAGMPLKILEILQCPKVGDLAPLRGMPITRLTVDECEGRDVKPLRDLAPLAGMPLVSLKLRGCNNVNDLSALKGMPLEELEVSKTQYGGIAGVCLADLQPLRGMPLKRLTVSGMESLKDLRPLTGMALNYVNISRTGVSDLSPLRAMPLERLCIGKTGVTDLRPVKDIKNLVIER